MINKILKYKEKITLFVFIQMMFFNEKVHANAIKESKLATGTERLIGDMTSWLGVVAPIVGILLVIYFFIRRSSADEQDQKRWNNRIVTTVISTVGAVIGGTMLRLILAYYQ